MRRRDLLAKCLERPASPAPTDAERINAFGAAYNEYIARLMRGQIDLKQWQLVCREWERLIHDQ